MTQRTYKDLKRKRRYQSTTFWVTLMKKGYHPKTGAHKPTISVIDHSEYLLEQQLQAGKLVLDGLSYPVICWKCVSRTHYDLYDKVRCIYEITLGMSALPVKKFQYNRPDTESQCGVASAKVGNCYHVNQYRGKLVKKNVCVDGTHHIVVVSMEHYHYDALEYQLKTNDVVAFNHMLYLVLDREKIIRKAATKKDGTPYFHRKVYLQLKLKTPGRRIQYDHEKPKSVLDEMFEDVQL